MESEETFLLECLLQTGEGTIKRRGQSCQRGEREGSGVAWCLLHRLLLHYLLKCLMDCLMYCLIDCLIDYLLHYSIDCLFHPPLMDYP